MESLSSAISDSAPAISNTLRTLYARLEQSRALQLPIPDTSSSLPSFILSTDTASGVLVAADTSPLDEQSREFMKQLTSGAQESARQMFYDSIVAGPLSEASNGEFTDIGIWLGNGQFQSGQEKAVLASLGLEEWICEAKITTRKFEVPAETEAFFAAYQTLEGAYCFCVSKGCGEPTACFLLGQINRQWCGLVSIAVTTG